MIQFVMNMLNIIITPIANILVKAGLQIIDVKMNSVNGGSFAVSACHHDAYKAQLDILDCYCEGRKSRYSTPSPARI